MSKRTGRKITVRMRKRLTAGTTTARMGFQRPPPPSLWVTTDLGRKPGTWWSKEEVESVFTDNTRGSDQRKRADLDIKVLRDGKEQLLRMGFYPVPTNRPTMGPWKRPFHNRTNPPLTTLTQGIEMDTMTGGRTHRNETPRTIPTLGNGNRWAQGPPESLRLRGQPQQERTHPNQEERESTERPWSRIESMLTTIMQRLDRLEEGERRRQEEVDRRTVRTQVMDPQSGPPIPPPNTNSTPPNQRVQDPPNHTPEERQNTREGERVNNQRTEREDALRFELERTRRDLQEEKRLRGELERSLQGIKERLARIDQSREQVAAVTTTNLVYDQ